MTPERLAEIERFHVCAGKRKMCQVCDLLTALREAQSEKDDLTVHAAIQVTDLKAERDALQRRVEALEKALSSILDAIDRGWSMHGSVVRNARAALRGGERG